MEEPEFEAITKLYGKVDYDLYSKYRAMWNKALILLAESESFWSLIDDIESEILNGKASI